MSRERLRGDRRGVRRLVVLGLIAMSTLWGLDAASAQDTEPSYVYLRGPVQTVHGSSVEFSGRADDQDGVDAVYVAVKRRSDDKWLQNDGAFRSTWARHRASIGNRGAGSTQWMLKKQLDPSNYRVIVVVEDSNGNSVSTSPGDFFEVVGGSPAPRQMVPPQTAPPQTSPPQTSPPQTSPPQTARQATTTVRPTTVRPTTTTAAPIRRTVVAERAVEPVQVGRHTSSVTTYEAYDRQGPLVTLNAADPIVTPGPADNVAVGIFTLTGQAVDAAGVEEVLVSVRRGGSYLQENGSFTGRAVAFTADLNATGVRRTNFNLSFTLPAGVYSFDLIGRDSLGNESLVRGARSLQIQSQGIIAGGFSSPTTSVGATILPETAITSPPTIISSGSAISSGAFAQAPDSTISILTGSSLTAGEISILGTARAAAGVAAVDVQIRDALTGAAVGGSALSPGTKVDVLQQGASSSAWASLVTLPEGSYELDWTVTDMQGTVGRSPVPTRFQVTSAFSDVTTPTTIDTGEAVTSNADQASPIPDTTTESGLSSRLTWGLLVTLLVLAALLIIAILIWAAGRSRRSSL